MPHYGESNPEALSDGSGEVDGAGEVGSGQIRKHLHATINGDKVQISSTAISLYRRPIEL